MSQPERPGCQVEADMVEQVQIVIPTPKPVIRKFCIHRGQCSECDKHTQGRYLLQTSDATGVAASQIGPDAQSSATILHTQAGLSHGKLAINFDTLFGINLTCGVNASIGFRGVTATARQSSATCDTQRSRPT